MSSFAAAITVLSNSWTATIVVLLRSPLFVLALCVLESSTDRATSALKVNGLSTSYTQALQYFPWEGLFVCS